MFFYDNFLCKLELNLTTFFHYIYKKLNTFYQHFIYNIHIYAQCMCQSIDFILIFYLL